MLGFWSDLCDIICVLPRKLSIEERFLAKVRKQENGCWLWAGKCDKRGYGKAWNGQKWRLAHRMMWEFARGPIPKGMCVCHRCNVPQCLNPSHLYLDTSKANTEYRSRNGRTRNQVTGRLPTRIVRFPKKTLEERFFEKVERAEQPNACWLWMAAIGTGGYGRIGVGRKLQTASRLSWELIHGPIPDGLQVLHRCDERRCVSPFHLFLGTQQDNINDCHRKGRALKARGEDAGSAKLTAEQVLQIRRLYCPFKCGYRRLAKEFGMSVPHIVHIIQRKKWPHI